MRAWWACCQLRSGGEPWFAMPLLICMMLHLQGAPRPTKPRELTAAEKEFRRKSWMWLAGAGAVVAAYILFSGRYIDLDTLAQALGQAGDDDDDDDGGDEDDHDGGDE